MNLSLLQDSSIFGLLINKNLFEGMDSFQRRRIRSTEEVERINQW
jgi:hypothetical protein